MFKNKFLNTLILTSLLLTSFAYSTKAAPSNSGRTSSNGEAKLKKVLESYEDENLIHKDGIILGSDEKIDVSKLQNLKISNPEIAKIENGNLIPQSDGTTFMTYSLEGLNYVQEVDVMKTKNTPVPKNTIVSDTPHPYIVCIDPGHGGSDPGAIGINKIKEKDMTLLTSLKVAELLRNKGVTVFLTRETDMFVSLTDRVTNMNSHNPDAAISIHYNSYTTKTPYGIETYYYDAATLSDELATKLQNSLITNLYPDSLLYPGINPNRGVKQDSFTVIANKSYNSALVEGGFLSNKTEASKIATESYRLQIATSIVDGIMQFLNENVPLQ